MNTSYGFLWEKYWILYILYLLLVRASIDWLVVKNICILLSIVTNPNMCFIESVLRYIDNRKGYIRDSREWLENQQSHNLEKKASDLFIPY